jgi:hypothetical protein
VKSAGNSFGSATTLASRLYVIAAASHLGLHSKAPVVQQVRKVTSTTTADNSVVENGRIAALPPSWHRGGAVSNHHTVLTGGLGACRGSTPLASA